jgi:hypothetical protein
VKTYYHQDHHPDLQAPMVADSWQVVRQEEDINVTVKEKDKRILKSPQLHCDTGT